MTIPVKPTSFVHRTRTSAKRLWNVAAHDRVAWVLYTCGPLSVTGILDVLKASYHGEGMSSQNLSHAIGKAMKKGTIAKLARGIYVHPDSPFN